MLVVLVMSVEFDMVVLLVLLSLLGVGKILSLIETIPMNLLVVLLSENTSCTLVHWFLQCKTCAPYFYISYMCTLELILIPHLHRTL